MEKESPRMISEETLVKSMLQLDARYLTLVDRRDLWHLIKVSWWYTEISDSKAAELLGIPLSEVRPILDAWDKEKGNYKKLNKDELDE